MEAVPTRIESRVCTFQGLASESIAWPVILNSDVHRLLHDYDVVALAACIEEDDWAVLLRRLRQSCRRIEEFLAPVQRAAGRRHLYGCLPRHSPPACRAESC